MSALSMLRSGEPFAFSRWGDGEWSAILGRDGCNCDGQDYGAVREALRGVLREQPTYMLGMQSLARRRFGDEIDQWLRTEGLNELEFADAGIFHTASIKGRIRQIVDPLSGTGVVLVGPQRLAGLDELFPIHEHVVVPDQHAFGSYSSWAGRAEDAVRRSSGVVAICAGMGANVLVHQLHAQFPDRTLVDFGSVFEPYVGVANRSYHAEILKRLA